MSSAINMSESSSVHQTRAGTGWSHPHSAFRDLRSHLRLWGLAVVALTLDLCSKHWAFTELDVGEVRPVLGGFIELQLSLNPGALFGLGPGLVGVFIAASILALGFVIYLFAGSARRQRVVHVALGLILAGALGNLYDRTFTRHDLVQVKASDERGTMRLLGRAETDPDGEHILVYPWKSPGSAVRFRVSDLDGRVRRIGAVRDFLKITPNVFGREIWPWIFNVADALLVAGVALLLIGYRGENRRLQHAMGETPDPTEPQRASGA